MIWMQDLPHGGKRCPCYGRFKIVFVNVLKWFFSINKWTNACSSKQLLLYRFNFHRSTKFISEFGSPFIFTPNCHRQIVYSTFNLNIHYSLSYQRLVWNYKKVDSANIRKALDSVNFERLFDQKDINAQVITLNETILNVVRNYVPNKYITIDDKDPVMDEWNY